MSDPSGHICPECGAPRETGGSPTCGCARRAADELLETRTAEAAAAEDFDPLRIRPYVDLEVRAEASAGTPEDVPEDAGTIAIPKQRKHPEPRLPSPPPPSPPPGFADFPDAEDPAENTTGSRRRRFALVGAGATAVVVAAAGFASGLFSYESPSRNDAAPDDIRASVPDASVAERPPPDSASPSASTSASASESTGVSSSASATESAASNKKPTESATPSRTTATTRAPGEENSPDPDEPSPEPTDRTEQPVVLRPGDEGPEVTELQLRLKQLALYVGNADGDYDNRTENAVRNYQLTRGINENRGIYDQLTRQRLESETKEP
ncbi:peptidoglycan-binding domain-containing protein [Streptomyces sp. CWNU-52B]|uniref:peptidoglycan-binding domain-containing protein n=1 Tax=unclassified Streptomyces TaxID=2593676 RepID=UPI0039C083D9